MITNFNEMKDVELEKLVSQEELRFDSLQDIDVASAEAVAGIAAFGVGLLFAAAFLCS